MPLGAPILWPEMVASVQATSPRRHRHLAERLDRVGVERDARPPQHRSAISATGCTTPTSLFTHMTDTTAGRSRQRLVERVEVEPAARSTGSSTSRPPRWQTAWAAARMALCSMAETDGAHGAAAVARRQRRADDAEVVGLGAAGGEDHLVGLGADRLRPPRGGPARGPPARPGRTGGRWTGCRRPARSGRAAWPPAPPGGPGWWRRGRDRRAGGSRGEKYPRRPTCFARRAPRRRPPPWSRG